MMVYIAVVITSLYNKYMAMVEGKASNRKGKRF